MASNGCVRTNEHYTLSAITALHCSAAVPQTLGEKNSLFSAWIRHFKKTMFETMFFGKNKKHLFLFLTALPQRDNIEKSCPPTSLISLANAEGLNNKWRFLGRY